MDIEIQNRKQEATFKNGKYQYTFTPTNATEKIKLYHMGCVGDTRLTHLQLEKGNEVTPFVAPKETANSLSGIFKNLRDLDVQLRDTNSEFWGRLKLNNKGMLTEFFNKDVKTAIASAAEGVSTSVSNALNTQVASINQRVNDISSSVNTLDGNALKKNEVKITADGVEIGSGKKIDGNTISSMLITKPESITAISKKFRVTGDMIVGGTIEGKHLKAATIETGHFQAGSVNTKILASDAVTADKMKVDQAVIDKLLTNDLLVTKLFAKDAFINNLKTVKIDATQIDTDTLRGKTIEGVTITGHSQIKVGRSGILDSQGSNLRISSPSEYGGVSGFGMQLRGSGDSTFNQGLNIYKVSDVRNPVNPQYTPSEVALSVFGEIRGAFKINTAPKSGALISKMGVAVMSNISRNNPTRAEGYPGATLWSIRSIYLRSGGGPTQFWLNDGTSGNSTYGVNVNNMESDRKLKENIVDCEYSGLEVINKFRFRSFAWKPDKFDYVKPYTRIGLVAQEVEEIQEDLVYSNPNALALDDFRLLNIALKAIQELSEENKQIKREMEILKNAG